MNKGLRVFQILGAKWKAQNQLSSAPQSPRDIGIKAYGFDLAFRFNVLKDRRMIPEAGPKRGLVYGAVGLIRLGAVVAAHHWKRAHGE